MKRYLKLWYMYSLYSTQIGLQSRFGAALFVVGKFLRFGFFLFFISILSSSIKNISGYSFWEMMLIFATFNLIDISSQLFFREVYRFRSYVTDGSVDYFLVRPMKPLFRFLFGGADILDLPLFALSICLILLSFYKIGNVGPEGLILYIALIINAFMIALSLHILILCSGILTTEVDNTLWLYRDLTSMGRIPIDLYKNPLRSIITFVVPIGIMITFPAQAAFGELLPELVLVSLLIGIIFVIVSGFSWRFAIRRYSSVSS
jgi:ABC-2 type transport system permease protein